MTAVATLTQNHQFQLLVMIWLKEVTHDEIIADKDMIELIASLKYIRVNYNHFTTPEQCMYEALSSILRW